MKFCFSTLGCHDKSLDEVLALAKRFSVDALELRGLNGEMDNGRIADFAEDMAERTKARLHAAGVTPLVLGSSCAFHEPASRDRMVEEAMRDVLIAQRMGFSYLRVFGNRLTGDPQACFSSVVEGIGRVCEFAADKGVSILLEVHGDFNCEKTLLPVVTPLSSFRNFGLIWDVYHTHGVYGGGWARFYEMFAAYIRHVHLKDAAAGRLVLPGEGYIPLTDIVRRMTSDGYEGYFSLEWERKWHPELSELSEVLPRFFALMEQI